MSYPMTIGSSLYRISQLGQCMCAISISFNFRFLSTVTFASIKQLLCVYVGVRVSGLGPDDTQYCSFDD